MLTLNNEKVLLLFIIAIEYIDVLIEIIFIFL